MRIPKTRRHATCVRMLMKAVFNDQMRTDLANIQGMGTRTFYKLMANGLQDFACQSPNTRVLLDQFVADLQRRDALTTKHSLSVSVRIVHCPKCNDIHNDCKVNLDGNRIPFVICSTTHKRIDLQRGNYAVLNQTEDCTVLQQLVA
jgi:hypothetical protein